MKRCEDCEHVRIGYRSVYSEVSMTYECSAISKKYISPISREDDSEVMLSCHEARKDKRCGLAAKLFELRPPQEVTTLWQDIKSIFKKQSGL